MPYKTITCQRCCDFCDVSFQSNSRDGGKTWRRFCSKECANADFRRPIAERFWSKVDTSGDCWIWVAAQSTGGYGQFYMFVPGKGHRMCPAHRVAYELSYGSCPDDMDVCHHCDTPLCVRPSHLFLGTAKDNMQDMIAKGRQSRIGGVRGEKNRQSKLTADVVREIRRQYANGGVRKCDLAAIHGVSRSTIGGILARKGWNHVD